ncbi:MAG: hypothetical protein M1840_006968 [Geoglossum simile]|nr:MAG: hypothetical protein M1840_006968 [Geoglossum simile]
MLNPSEVLNRNGLQSWSHVSEDTRDNLSQVPWIREKVQPQDRDTQALQGAGSWSAEGDILRESPEGSIQCHDDGAESDSIDLEAEIEVPEFSLRMVGENEPPRRPIGEVLDDVRKSLGAIKDERRKTRRATTTPPSSVDISKGTLALPKRSPTHPLSQYLIDPPSQPWAAQPATGVNPQNTGSVFESRSTSKVKHKGVQPQRTNPRSWTPSNRRPKQHRHDSLDSQKCELQLFPGKMSTEGNWRDIQQKLPHSIRDQCVFKDNYWWYNGDPINLSGLTRNNSSSSLGLGPGIGDPTNPSHPIIQKGSITIAGRPLLIERCFTHHKSSAAWTYQPNQSNFDMMTDAPIPCAKDGDPVIVPLAPVEAPPRLVWEKDDPLSGMTINPRSFSEGDLEEIAKVLWPHEFCLYLDGSLQVMIDKKYLSRLQSFPERIGGLRVSFSNCVASSSQAPLRPRILPSVLARSAIGKFVQRSLGLPRIKAGNKSISRAIRILGDTTTPSTSSRSLSTKSGTTSGTRTNTSANTSVPSSVQGVSPSRVSPPADPQAPSPSGPSNALNGPTGSAGITPSILVASATPVPPPPATSHVPYEVIIGESPELGVSCYVGVKIYDGITDKITVPTSVALEAACKARRASGAGKRAIGHLLRGRAISVIGLGVWTKTEPHSKIGTIQHCYDCQRDRALTMRSIHPDDLLYDVCLVEGEGANPFATITSPCSQWWVKANQTEPGWIVENTLLHIACSTGPRDDARAVDGRKLAEWAQGLPHVNAVYQGIRVVTQGQPNITGSGYGLFSRSKRLIPKMLLCTSTLYRFMGPIESLEDCRGAAVVEVNKETGRWESVVGLHSFEYLIKVKGSSESDPTWDHFKKGLVAGTLSFWGCRRLPPELTSMALV